MNELVIIQNRQAVTTSLQVAESFEKQHPHVLRDIDALKKDVSNFGEMFFETETPDSYGRARRTYLMNRDGFTILAMGFTGHKAMQFKLQYIQAFNQMEQQLFEMNLPSYEISDPVARATKWIEEEQQRQQLIQTVEEQKPMVMFANAIVGSTSSILIRELAVLLKQNGIDIGQGRLFDYLRNNGYLVKRKGTDYNMPTQKSMNLGLFEIKETPVMRSTGSTISKTPKVTAKGQQYFINHFLKKGDIA